MVYQFIHREIRLINVIIYIVTFRFILNQELDKSDNVSHIGH